MAALTKVLVCDASCILARSLVILPECANGSASTEEQLQYNHACSSKEHGRLTRSETPLCAGFAPWLLCFSVKKQLSSPMVIWC